MADFKWASVTALSPLAGTLDGTTVPVPALKPASIPALVDQQRVLVAWVPPSTVVMHSF